MTDEAGEVPVISGGKMGQTLRAITSLLTVLILGAFAFLAVRGILSPQPASGRFGVLAVNAEGMFFVRVYLARNLIITAAAAVFLILRLWKPLAILITTATALPLFDIALLLVELGPGAPWPYHLANACVIALLAALLWVRVRLERKASGKRHLAQPVT